MRRRDIRKTCNRYLDLGTDRFRGSDLEFTSGFPRERGPDVFADSDLIEHPWNKGKPPREDVCWVKGWAELAEVLLSNG